MKLPIHILKSGTLAAYNDFVNKINNNNSIVYNELSLYDNTNNFYEGYYYLIRKKSKSGKIEFNLAEYLIGYIDNKKVELLFSEYNASLVQIKDFLNDKECKIYPYDLDDNLFEIISAVKSISIIYYSFSNKKYLYAKDIILAESVYNICKEFNSYRNNDSKPNVITENYFYWTFYYLLNDELELYNSSQQAKYIYGTCTETKKLFLEWISISEDKSIDSRVYNEDHFYSEKFLIDENKITLFSNFDKLEQFQQSELLNILTLNKEINKFIIFEGTLNTIDPLISINIHPKISIPDLLELKKKFSISKIFLCLFVYLIKKKRLNIKIYEMHEKIVDKDGFEPLLNKVSNLTVLINVLYKMLKVQDHNIDIMNFDFWYEFLELTEQENSNSILEIHSDDYENIINEKPQSLKIISPAQNKVKLPTDNSNESKNEINEPEEIKEIKIFHDIERARRLKEDKWIITGDFIDEPIKQNYKTSLAIMYIAYLAKHYKNPGGNTNNVIEDSDLYNNVKNWAYKSKYSKTKGKEFKGNYRLIEEALRSFFNDEIINKVKNKNRNKLKFLRKYFKINIKCYYDPQNEIKIIVEDEEMPSKEEK